MIQLSLLWQAVALKSPVGQVVKDTRKQWERATADLPEVSNMSSTPAGLLHMHH